MEGAGAEVGGGVEGGEGGKGRQERQDRVLGQAGQGRGLWAEQRRILPHPALCHHRTATCCTVTAGGHLSSSPLQVAAPPHLAPPPPSRGHPSLARKRMKVSVVVVNGWGLFRFEGDLREIPEVALAARIQGPEATQWSNQRAGVASFRLQSPGERVRGGRDTG
jgi:hypothetical protein